MALDPTRYVVGPGDGISDADLDREEIVLPDGRRLTEELAEGLADEQVRAARDANLVPGGKSLSGGGAAHSPRVNVRLPDDVHRAALALADAQHITLSRLVRRALDEYLARQA
jgi:hypothetical protein